MAQLLQEMSVTVLNETGMVYCIYKVLPYHMNISAIQTNKITPGPTKLVDILDKHVSSFRERSILVITSKIVAICEGAIRKCGTVSKQKLIETEADMFIPPSDNQYDVTLTIKNNMLTPSSGIDESNGNGYFILWPKNPQESANTVRQYLYKRFSVKYAGIIITDSKTTPLRWGTTGIALAHSGFSALNNYIGTPDIFKRTMHKTKANIADGLAAAAVAVMGEGNEQTPLALITDVPFVTFRTTNPSKRELDGIHIDIRDDLYAPILNSAGWIKTKK